MDINNENEIQKENKKPATQKPKGGKVKKVEGKKPVPANVKLDNIPDTRGRAKSTLVNPFDNKKPLNMKKESKPVETIGSDRFNLLKSMFEKKAPANNEEPAKKFEPKKLSVLQQNTVPIKEEKKVDPLPNKPSGISDAIKKRMEDLINSNKRPSAQAKVDPILEQRKAMKEFENNEDDEYESDDHENLGISEEEDNLDKDDGLSESEEEKEKQEKRDEEKVKEELKEEKDDDAFSDSFDDKKEKLEKNNDVKNDVKTVESIVEVEIQHPVEEQKHESEEKIEIHHPVENKEQIHESEENIEIQHPVEEQKHESEEKIDKENEDKIEEYNINKNIDSIQDE